MANTTNFNWETPDDTDLVKDGAAAIRTLGSAIDTSLVDLKGGTTGQILSKATNTDMDFTWITNDVGDITEVTAGTGISGGGTTGAVTITNDMATTITASGDIVVGTGSGTYDNLPIGTTGQVLTADTTVSPYKVKWATPAGGGGKVLQVVQDTDQTGFSTTSTSYVDTTMSVSITPSSATSKVLVIVSLPAYTRAGASGTSAWGAFNIVRGATQITQFNYGNATVSNNHEHLTPYTIVYLDSPSTTSSTTYKVQAKKGGGQDINYEGANFNASITCMEIGA